VLLALAAAAGAGSWRFLVVGLAIAALLAVPPSAIGADVPGDGRVIFSSETQYQYARVIQLPSGERWLELNEGVAIHSLYRPRSYLTGGYWDDFLVLPFMGRSAPPSRVAILGDAAGTVARAYGHYFPSARVDAVEIDGELTTIGRRYFGLRGPNLHLYTADARPWLESSKARYDAIFLDAYRQPYIPFYLLTREFFEQIRDHLAPGGIVIVNVGHIPDSDALEKVVSATLHAAFGAVVRDVVSGSNSLVVASEQPLSFARLATVPAPLRPLAGKVVARMGPALRGGAVYTDDRAPVEWLTDLSIIGYAVRPH
jgi:spermidine synthase